MDQLTYDQVLAQATRLDQADQLRLLADLATALQRGTPGRPRRRVTALRGLGKELWRTVAAQAYIDAERATWDG